jgi:hypothetical protein
VFFFLSLKKKTPLGHTFIDILKIDIEGGEFDALTAFLDQRARDGLELVPIGQLQIEIHAREGHERFDYFARWWESLKAAGLRPFWTEPNMVYVNFVRGVRPELAEVCVCLSLFFLDNWRELARSVSNVLLTAFFFFWFAQNSTRLLTFGATTRSSMML